MDKKAGGGGGGGFVGCEGGSGVGNRGVVECRQRRQLGVHGGKNGEREDDKRRWPGVLDVRAWCVCGGEVTSPLDGDSISVRAAIAACEREGCVKIEEDKI
jgi:hypothetical protein